MPAVVLGLELRYLDALGALPDLHHCGDCGTVLERRAFRQADTLGLACRQHAGLPRHPLDASGLSLLRALHAAAGRSWPTLPIDMGAVRAAAPLPAHWLAAALEQRSPYRRLVFAIAAN